MTTNDNTRDSIPVQLELFPDTIEIPLTQGYATILDACDADLSSRKWYAVRAGVVYAASPTSEKNGQPRRTEYMHRLVLARILERPLARNERADHIDRDGLNNRRNNLRLATPSQNIMNTKRRSDNTSGFKGVYWNKQRRKWQAYIWINGRHAHLGYFNDPAEAHAAYCAAAIKHFGEFANDGT